MSTRSDSIDTGAPVTLTQIQRAPREGGTLESARRFPAWVRVLLGVPLPWKVAGANLLMVVVALVVALASHEDTPQAHRMLGLLLLAMLAMLVVNFIMVRLALHPLRALESTAERVWRGDLQARVERSPIADRDIARIGSTLNLLLDGLVADRARLRLLASQIIDAQDAERARIARELHDSTAQTLAALVLQLSALQRACDDAPQLAERVELVRSMATEALEEVRTLSHTVHPRVLDDLGLVAALEYLARQAREEGSVQASVVSDVRAPEIPRAVAAVLYRVAQESLANALRHSGGSSVRLTLTAARGTATLEVVDDGKGFDVAEAERRRPGMGLFSMRERVSLVDGRMAIDSAPGKGTRIIATVPLTHPS